MDENFRDRRLALLISYIHNTNDYMQCCRVGNTAKKGRMRLFQLEDSVGIGRATSFGNSQYGENWSDGP